MGVLDIVLLVLFIPAIIRGISKGFVEQLAALASLFVSSYIASRLAGTLSAPLGEHLELDSRIVYAIAFIIIVVIVVILLMLCARLVSKIISTIALGWLNSTLGVLFALLNTALILGLVFMGFNALNDSILHLDTGALNSSFMYKGITAICDTLFPYIESFFSQVSDVGAQMC